VEGEVRRHKVANKVEEKFVRIRHCASLGRTYYFSGRNRKRRTPAVEGSALLLACLGVGGEPEVEFTLHTATEVVVEDLALPSSKGGDSAAVEGKHLTLQSLSKG